MKKKTSKQISSKIGSIILLSLTLIVVVVYSYLADNQRKNNYYDYRSMNIPNINIIDKKVGADPLNAYYLVGDNIIKFDNGAYTDQGSDIKIIGTPFIADLASDGTKDDAIVILVKTLEDEKLMYYIAASIKNFYGYKGTNAIPLGEIADPEIKFEENLIKLDYNLKEEKQTSSFKVENNIIIKAE